MVPSTSQCTPIFGTLSVYVAIQQMSSAGLMLGLMLLLPFCTFGYAVFAPLFRYFDCACVPVLAGLYPLLRICAQCICGAVCACVTPQSTKST